MGFLFLSFSTLYSIFSAIVFIITLFIVLSHIYAKLKRPKPLKLNSDSVVVIVGACMGIGKLMAIEIARQYHSTIILVDRKK
jgi:D-arabinose 1-dehydrogenase-like Zn-dependent alcohol dehydrogenase